MKQIYVNLKRFDVAKGAGGICQMDNAVDWIDWIIASTVVNGLGKLPDAELTFLLPESLIIPASLKLADYAKSDTAGIHIGCQSVFREDVAKGKNFGAFTSNRPAAAMKGQGCSCAIIGHSEERKDKLGILAKYDPAILTDKQMTAKAKAVIDEIIREEIACALAQDMKVLLCIGETAEERGEGSFEEQKPFIAATLTAQLINGLKSITHESIQDMLCIGYEPIWAIGPGKTPPEKEYIRFVSEIIKKIVMDAFGFEPQVVYGGGLKEENAGMLGSITSIDGGLVALTQFSGEIGFYPDDLKKIIQKFLSIS